MPHLGRYPLLGLERCGRRAGALSAEELRDFGLTPREFAALVVADRLPGISQSALAERIEVDRSTMSRLVDGLERAGLATRTRAAHDRRRRLIHVTPEGRATLHDATRALLRLTQEVVFPAQPSRRMRLVRDVRGLNGVGIVG
jgi:DNA-binding MarR family transcriptional regulator